MKYRITDLHYLEAVTKGPHKNYYPQPDVDLMIFLHQKAVTRRFFDAIEQRLIPKILKDISYILEMKWAECVSNSYITRRRWKAYFSKGDKEHGFYHCHILGESGLIISGKKGDVEQDTQKILSPDNISILYHTYEFQRNYAVKPEHNVLSSLTSKPKTVDPRRFFEKDSAVNYIDLNKIQYGSLNFVRKSRLQTRFKSILKRKAGYILEDRTELDMEGILSVSLISKKILQVDPRYRDKLMRDARKRLEEEMVWH